MQNELRYLERLLAALPASELRKEVAHLRRTFDSLGSSRALDTEAEHGEQRDAALALQDTDASSKSLQHLASFLYPQKEPRKAEDEVRVLSAEGSLSSELCQHPVLTCVESDRTIVMGSFGQLVSWSEEDDAAEQARERMALLELSQAGVNLLEFTHFITEKLEQDQETLDLVEEKVAHARDATQEAVVTLAGTAVDEDRERRMLLWPSAGLVMLGGLVFCTCPGAAPALLCAAGRGALVVGATVGSMRTLSKFQKQIITQIQEQLPRVFQKLPADQASMIRVACEDANDRLQSRLNDGAWKEESLFSKVKNFDFQAPAREVGQGLEVRWSPSQARKGGHAYLVTFTVDLAASRAFRVIQRMMLTGSLDPGCKVMWSRPVDTTSRHNTHYIRYLAFAEWFFSRDFCTACHCGPVASQTQEECYTLATRSMSQQLLELEGMPKPTGEVGAVIEVMGVRLTGGDAQTKVEVMADVDPAAPLVYLTSIVNKRIRSHTRNAAWLMQRALKDET